MSLAFCNDCEAVVEGETTFRNDGIGEVECCPYCDIPIVQLTTEDWREHQ